MRPGSFFFILLFAYSSVTEAQSNTEYAKLITAGGLRDHLTILASDALEGRATGSRGQKMAAAFIRHHFQTIGLQPPVSGSYYQRFLLYKAIPGETYFIAGGKRFRNFKEMVYYGRDNSGGEITTTVVFAGQGKEEDYQHLDVAGKAVLLMLGDEDDYRVASAVARAKNAGMVIILNTGTTAEFREYARQFEAFLADGRLSLEKPAIGTGNKGLYFVSPAVAEHIFNTTLPKLAAAAAPGASKTALRKMAPGKLTYRTSVEVQEVETENVLGYLEGSDKKDEVIVITSHYDHIGKKTQGEGDLINNGADDDGSGTVAVLQLASAFAQAKKDGHGPRRSILFMTVAGEENGLLGSEYYTQHPVFPLAKTVVNLNMDMIGRRDEQHKDSPPYVYIIGSDKLSTTLHELNEAMNRQHTRLVFDYTYNDEDHPARLYYRSDHWNFAQKNIPIIFYFDGIHEDYHMPSDEVDKIEFDLLALRARCVFFTAWQIANRDERILPDAKFTR